MRADRRLAAAPALLVLLLAAARPPAPAPAAPPPRPRPTRQDDPLPLRCGPNPALDPDSGKAKPKHEPGRVVTRPVFRLNGEGFLDPQRPDQVWVVAAGGGAPRQLTRGRYEAGAPRWSRDGRWIFFVADRR